MRTLRAGERAARPNSHAERRLNTILKNYETLSRPVNTGFKWTTEAGRNLLKQKNPKLARPLQ
jgi:hypothetical protein